MASPAAISQFCVVPLALSLALTAAQTKVNMSRARRLQVIAYKSGKFEDNLNKFFNLIVYGLDGNVLTEM